mgnify:FL=1|jgi:uncharacterized membrane protein YgaE (UPF0421/DUF939 family)|tara:strand:+ start:2340 stop:2504 length:165 start_codon:yes stop_codon:yes gene_type:complete
MDDVDACQAEIKALKREIKNLNKKLGYYEMKDRLKKSDKLDQAKAKRRERQFSA